MLGLLRRLLGRGPKPAEETEPVSEDQAPVSAPAGEDPRPESGATPVPAEAEDDFPEALRRRQAERRDRRRERRKARGREGKAAPGTPGEPRRDRKGIRIIGGGEDLWTLMTHGHAPAEPEPDFAEMLEDHLSRTAMAEVLREKREGLGLPPNQPAAARKKRYPPPQDELDLHHLTAPAAAARIEPFIRQARARRLRTVRIIVGRGSHSLEGAVLPKVVRDEVIGLKRRKLLEAHEWEKGHWRRSGALVVYL